MFWSLILEPGKKYSQVVEDSFHLSMAVLDLGSVPNDGKATYFPVQLEIDSQKLILCNLSKDLHPQVQLDLNFEKGTHLNLFTSGKAVIHLTGYLDNLSLDSDDSPLGSDESDLSDEENEDMVMKTNSKKSDKSAAAKRKLLVGNENQNKKKLKIEKNESSDSDTDADSDNDEEASDEEFDDEDVSDEMEMDDDFGDGLSDEEEDDSDDESSIPNLQDFLNKEKQSKAQAKAAKQNKKQENNKTPITDKKTPSGDKKTPQQTPGGNKNEKQKGKAMNNGTATPASAKQKAGKQESTPGKTASPKGTPKKQTLQGGVLVEELKEGNGPVAKPGKMVTVYYTGRLQNSNKVFDQTNQGPGFKFRLGRGDVIKGWDVALNGMKVGSKRKITIPPAMAYGNKGQPPAVPPNSTLVFDVEIRSVK